jgi:hypothetical protein
VKGNFFVAMAAIVLAVGAGLAVLALRNVGAAPASTALPIAYNGVDGWSQGQARLRAIYIGESNVFVRTPQWSAWSGVAAATRGELWVNTCSPTCSAGHYRTFPARISFSGVTVHNGVKYFSRLRLRYWHGHQRDYTLSWGILPGATIPGWNGGPQ